MTENIIKKIEEADLVLVGIGEQLDLGGLVEKEEPYQRGDVKLRESGGAWMLPYLKKIMLEKAGSDRLGLYHSLAQCLNEKNYFVVSLCRDGVLGKSGLDEKRIVEPCGGYVRLQCSKKCCTELFPVPEGLLEQIRGFAEAGYKGDQPIEPLCPKCGSALEFNNVDAADYLEEGYLEGWMRYKKWLQGTVNKRLCVLELGVGMKYPTVVRWPFEKIVFFNQKAELFRVHDKLYQVAEEIGDRAHGICQKPEEFLMELCQIMEGRC